MFVELEVTHTEPGFKGDTATNTLKPATLETGKEVQVPTFIEIGDVLQIDTRDGRVAVNGWQEASAIGVEELIGRFADSGLRQVICTDIAKDGMLSGPSVDLYRKLLERFPRIELTASGGIGSWDDIEELDRAGVPCVVVGKAIYEGRIGFDRLETHYGAAER